MKEQLTQYVNLLFAGAPDTDEIREEILQNTLERYDDLIDQGKAPEAAYRLAISGIGDVNEILSGTDSRSPAPKRTVYHASAVDTEEDQQRRKLRGAAIAMYIASAVPLIVLGNIGNGTIGLTLTILLAAAATYLIIISGNKDEDEDRKVSETHEDASEHPVKERIGNIIWTAGLIAYFAISFTSDAWHITWLAFPIMACARGLSDAIIDLKEASNHEA